MLEFGVSGGLWNDALVTYDRATESYWSHVTGEAIEGELEGARLKQIPATVTTFREWVAAHPHTQVLTKPEGEGRVSKYDRYIASERQGIFGTQARRKELAPKAVVQGVAAGREAVAVPHDRLEARRFVDFELGGRAMTAVRAGSGVYVYARKLAKHTLRLEPVKGDPRLIRDRGTGTEWDVRTGQGVRGTLAEHALESVPSTTAYWFGWLNFYPEARVVR